MADTDVARSQPDSAPGWKVLAYGRGAGLLLVLAGLLVPGWLVHEAAYSAGFAGTHGTLTVGHCEYRTSYHRKPRLFTTKNYDCHGTFVGDGDGDEDAAALVETHQNYAAGTKVSVQRTGTDVLSQGWSYGLPSWTRAVYEIAGAFFVLLALPVGLLCLVTGCTFGRWGGLTYSQADEGIKGTRLGKSLNALYVVCGVGALLCVVVGGVIWLF
ncbi:hypothetical protein ACFXJ5_01265 [Streptomyces sp. NPDC059373]